MTAIPGVKSAAGPKPFQNTAFRSSWTNPEGSTGAIIRECKVVDINLKLWQVDVISQFDQMWFLNVQVSSPYMHSNVGDGIYVMPEIGAKCHVCIPSDGTPPFVLDFIMPMETIPQAGTAEEPEGRDGGTGDATFSGGRVRPKPGDIYIKGRDGNFCILHRGGVLQIGSSELSQRLYIPLQNLITDISQNYRHYNSGGSVQWFLAPGESETNPATLYRETFRLLAGDEKATIRITKGLLKDAALENGDGVTEQVLLGSGTDENPILWEVVISPDTFNPDSGANDGPDTDGSATVLRYYFDRAGGAFMHTAGSVSLVCDKKLTIRTKGDISISTDSSFFVKAKKTGRIDGGSLLEITGKVTKINGGSKPCAHVGSIVEISIGLIPLSSLTPAAPGAPVLIGPSGAPTAAGYPQPTLKGTIISGNSTILV